MSEFVPPSVLERLSAPAASPLPAPRLLMVLAHPDDEVIAVGGRLERLTASRLITITDGAPADGADARHHGFETIDEYRAVRNAELDRALAHAGLNSRFRHPFVANVPDQRASFHLAALSRAVAAEILAFNPEAVLTHPYEGGHPDHDACAFAVHSAIRLLDLQRHPLPTLIEAPFYHAGPNGSMVTGSFLEGPNTPAAVVCELSPQEQDNKRARLACFSSQAETLAQFATDRELFRLAPAYDFERCPHAGQLLYEQFPWGMGGDLFRIFAADALKELFPRRSGLLEKPAVQAA